MLSKIDTKSLVPRLTSIESVAVIPRVASTNLIARRIVGECVENELSLPQAMIIAGEQFAGRGRNDRQWSSPAGKGIYATTMLTRPVAELPLVPLAVANILARFLRSVFRVDARIKWPNDIFVSGRKIAGILVEARVQDDRVFLIIGTGINIEPVEDDARPNAISLTEASPVAFGGITEATVAFIEHMDEELSHPFTHEEVLTEWRKLTIHKPGDRIQCVIGEKTIDGSWNGIDDQGRAMLNTAEGTTLVSAGDLFVV